LDLPGFKLISKSYEVGFSDGKADITLMVVPQEEGSYRSESDTAEIRTVRGIKYFIQGGTLNWDEVDDDGKWSGGQTYNKTISWYGDALKFTISAMDSAGRGERLSFLKPELLADVKDITKLSFKENGFKKKSEKWVMEYQNQAVNLKITAVPFSLIEEKYGINSEKTDTKQKKMKQRQGNEINVLAPVKTDYRIDYRCYSNGFMYELDAWVPNNFQIERFKNGLDQFDKDFVLSVVKKLEGEKQ
ncbi:MAG: hypothetical protein N2376_04545, partial [Clostridia bacterium]|nr:hypothetical protein [Clostridia bacterium]